MPCVDEFADLHFVNVRMFVEPVGDELAVLFRASTVELDHPTPFMQTADTDLQTVLLDHGDEGIQKNVAVVVRQGRLRLERDLETELAEFAQVQLLAKTFLHGGCRTMSETAQGLSQRLIEEPERQLGKVLSRDWLITSVR